MKMVVKTTEIRIRKYGKGGWKDHMTERSVDDAELWITDLCAKHEGDRGSYQLSIKINGGYGKNPEYGATVIQTMTRCNIEDIWGSWQSIVKDWKSDEQELNA